MKNKIGMGALCVLLACALMVGIGCKNDDGNSWISTMGAPGIGDIKSLTFEDVSPVVKNYTEAKALVVDFFDSNAHYAVTGVQSTAFNKAFKAKFGQDLSDWCKDQGKSYSYSVDVNDTDTLVDGTIKAGTIKGSEKGSWSHSRQTYKEYIDSYIGLDGDKITSSGSNKYTLSVTSGYASAYGYKIAGIIKSEYSTKWEETQQKKAEDLTPESSIRKGKTAGALLIDDGEMAAKIRFSTAWDNVWKVRSAGWIGTSNNADVEVWSLDGATKLYTIPADVVFADD